MATKVQNLEDYIYIYIYIYSRGTRNEGPCGKFTAFWATGSDHVPTLLAMADPSERDDKTESEWIIQGGAPYELVYNH